MADLKRRIIAEFSAKNKAKGEMASFRRDMDSTGQSMKNMAKGALAMVGLGGGLYALKRGFDYITKAAMKQEDAVFLLEAALKAVGEYTAEAMEGFEAFAASIQKATVYGDEEVLALMQLMKSLGVTSTALEQATRMAIGLAAATGRDVKSMSMYIALAQQGEFTMLRRYIPALRSTTDATEQLRIITEFAARGFKIAEAQAETTSGALSQLWNVVSDLAEVAGKPILDTMAKDAERATTNIEILTEALKKQKEAVEERIKTEGRLKYMPIGVPFYAPTVPKDIFEKPETAVGPLSESEALLKAAKEYHEILVQQAKEEADVVKAAAAEQTAAMQEHYDKRIAMGGNYQEMQERMARQRIETEIEVVKQQMEDEKKIIIEAAQEHVKFVREQDYMTRTQRTQNLEAYIAAHQEALDMVLEAEKILADELKRLERDKLAGLKRWGTEASDVWLQLDQIAVNSLDRMADALTDLCLTGKADFKALAQSVISDIIRMMIKMQMAQLLGIGGAGPGIGSYVMAGVGALFGGPSFAPNQPPGTPSGLPPGSPGARLQYGGEVLKTGLAVVHEGETYSGVGRGGGNLDVHVHNEGSEKLEISAVEEYAVSDQRIIDVTMRAAETHGPYRRSIKQIR